MKLQDSFKYYTGTLAEFKAWLATLSSVIQEELKSCIVFIPPEDIITYELEEYVITPEQTETDEDGNEVTIPAVTGVRDKINEDGSKTEISRILKQGGCVYARGHYFGAEMVTEIEDLEDPDKNYTEELKTNIIAEGHTKIATVSAVRDYVNNKLNWKQL